MSSRPWGACFEEISYRNRGAGFPVKWFKFIYPSSKPRMIKTSIHTPVHVAYSPIAPMNHQWTINLHDGYPALHVLLPEEYIPPSLPTLCNLKSTMFHFGVDLLYSTTESQHDLPSLASPEKEMASPFSWTSFFKVPHQALYVLVTLHLQSSIKSSCCVKLSFASPSPILFGTPNSLLLQTLLSMFQDLPPAHNKLTGFYQKTKSLCLVFTSLVTYKIYTTYQSTYFIDVFYSWHD